MIIKNALVFTLDRGFVPGDVAVADGRFADSHAFDPADTDILDAGGDYLIPGLVDVHFHGCSGYDFSDGTKEAVHAIGAYEAKCGITSVCPASMTLPEETLLAVCETAAAYRRESETLPLSRLCGIHLEGPFIAASKKGAQNPDYIHDADASMFGRLQDAAQGLVRLITVAPEAPAAMDFIRRLHGEVHISLGHTDCDYDTAAEAFALGADHVTHFFNAMPPFTHRAPGLIGAAFDAEHVMPELICDGIHIAPSAVRVAFALFGPERLILISDSMRAAGMSDGSYTLGGLPVKVTGNLATLEDGTIAGSVTNLMDCMRTAVSMGLPLADAVRCASYNPAKSIGVSDVCGSIEPGKYADCVLLSKKDLSTQAVILKGALLK